MDWDKSKPWSSYVPLNLEECGKEMRTHLADNDITDDLCLIKGNLLTDIIIMLERTKLRVFSAILLSCTIIEA